MTAFRAVMAPLQHETVHWAASAQRSQLRYPLSLPSVALRGTERSISAHRHSSAIYWLLVCLAHMTSLLITGVCMNEHFARLIR